ncbi:hypothetical protein M0805_002522 [Coniferiporia weirii]|nr:hypothetical protein M0805_002522 [Coniferiporia weirii]
MDSDSDELPPIEPLSKRWEPNPDPSTIGVPGLDTTAPIQDQIEQIEQLITIRLQNIDAGFARAHQVLSTRILPSIRRYAVNSEPIREAARFWVSFYEQAAQVRIPTTEDFSDVVEQQSAHSEEEAEPGPSTESSNHTRTFDPNMTPSESSFSPEDALISSTPMTHPMGRPRSGSEEETPSSWAASMESPLERLDKGLKSLREEDDSVIDFSEQNSVASQQSVQPDVARARQPVFAAKDKGKGKPQLPSLLQNVLSKKIRTADERDASATATSSKHTSPLKVKQKTPKRNPYVPPDSRRADWDGIVDLSKPAPSRGESSSPGWSSDEDNYPPPNMSPPASAMFANRIGRTPVKEAAARIGQDLVGDAERLRRRFGAAEETSFTTSLSTPDLSMYSKRALGIRASERSESTVLSSPTPVTSAGETSAEPSIESMMRHFGLDASKYAASAGQEQGGANDSFDSSFDDESGSVFAGLNALEDEGGGDGDGDGDSSEEEFFEGHTGAPSAAFLMASQRQRRVSDDSFGGSDHSSDSLDGDEDAGAGQAIHPFASAYSGPQDDDGFDDSFDDDEGLGGGGGGEEEPTVFGLPPAQRAAAMAGRNGGGQLRLLGQDLLDDTTALDMHIRANSIPDTPTPWGGAGGLGPL